MYLLRLFQKLRTSLLVNRFELVASVLYISKTDFSYQVLFISKTLPVILVRSSILFMIIIFLKLCHLLENLVQQIVCQSLLNPVILYHYGKKCVYMIIKLFLFIQPRKVKFQVNSEALINFICENGLPSKKASCKRDGYWVKAAMVACNNHQQN